MIQIIILAIVIAVLWIISFKLMLAVVALYSAGVFLYMNFLVPREIPEKLPADAERFIRKNRRKSKLEFMKAAFRLVDRKYASGRLGYFIHPERYFLKDFNKIWGIKGFILCDKQTYALAVLLVRSKKFKRREIIEEWSIELPYPHNYLKIKLGNKNYCLDPWGHDHGARFGDYALKEGLFKISYRF